MQTTIPLPALSHFDTQAYLLLLQLQATALPGQLTTLIGRCAQIRREGKSIDDIGLIPGLAMDDELAFATRLTPLLYEKLQGNPRYIKRFLNDLHVRQSIASRRGIILETAVVAKLMTLESLLKAEFKLLLDWFAKGEMRDHLERLEDEAGRPAAPAAPGTTPTTPPVAGALGGVGQFSQAMVRWAKLAPPLRGLDLSPYLTLAASFGGFTLIDESLPERLRDIAANLLSTSAHTRSLVTDAELDGLRAGDTTDLLLHLGRTLRDQPARQKEGVNAVLRIARRRQGSAAQARDALLKLPPSELAIGTPLLFAHGDSAEIRSVLTNWKDKLPDGRARRAVVSQLANQGST